MTNTFHQSLEWEVGSSILSQHFGSLRGFGNGIRQAVTSSIAETLVDLKFTASEEVSGKVLQIFPWNPGCQSLSGQRVFGTRKIKSKFSFGTNFKTTSFIETYPLFLSFWALRFQEHCLIILFLKGHCSAMSLLMVKIKSYLIWKTYYYLFQQMLLIHYHPYE